MTSLRKYRPAAAAFLQMMSMALTTTALSFFVGPVCGEFGFGRGSFTVYYSILTGAGTMASPLLGQAIQRWGLRAVAAVSAFWTAAGLLLFSFCSELWMFYLAGVFTGFFGTACVTLCAGVTVQTCYRGPSASRLTGLVMAGSGIGGMIVSLVLPELIENRGWRWGYRVTALCWLVLGLCAVWLLRDAQRYETAGERREAGMTRAEALRSGRLYLLILVIFLLSAASGVQQQLPAVLSDGGLDTARVGMTMSAFTAALALGKIGQGLLYGKAGPKTGGAIIVFCYGLGFFLLGRGHVLPGLLALAVGMGTVTTLMPIAAKAVFGGREYAAIWGILSAVSNLGAMIAAPLFGMVYDATGSYGPAMAVMPGLIAVSLAAMWLCFRKK